MSSGRQRFFLDMAEHSRCHPGRPFPQGLSQDGRPLFSRVLEQARISVSEDACTLMREVQRGGGQASYMLFGSDLAAGHHAPDFDFDEAVLAKGALMLACAVLDLAGPGDFWL